ncbi:MAG TPA: hypothetical protein VJV78_38480 [Polyangiales bacterium]|nr:hypothetical protein [Polyangiales bacterium]
MPSDEELPEAPAAIADAARVCVKFVQESLQLALDFTPDTLPFLDHYVRTNAGVGQAAEEVRDLLTPPLGAYFGEVVRRALPGVRWHIPGYDPSDYTGYRLEFETIFLHFNPMGIAREALEQTDVPGFGANFQVLDEARQELERALEQAGMISVDDYYTFSVRYETLEHVSAVLSALEVKTQSTPRTFGPEVYRVASGESLDRGESS